MVLNEAGGAIREAKHLYCGHREKAPVFIEYRERKFPGTPIPFVHACWRAKAPPVAGLTHEWAGVKTGGSSALTGARIGLWIGYSEVLLAGCPMDSSGYFNTDDTKALPHDVGRLGFGEDLLLYRQRFLDDIEERGHTNIYSMSGWTRKQLGVPCSFEG